MQRCAHHNKYLNNSEMFLRPGRHRSACSSARAKAGFSHACLMETPEAGIVLVACCSRACCDLKSSVTPLLESASRMPGCPYEASSGICTQEH